MPFDTRELLERLQEATKLAVEAADEAIPLPAFIERYGNFYYSSALDGHEDDPGVEAIIRAQQELVRLHKEIQQHVIDALYQGPIHDAEALRQAGRIGSEEALQRLKSIVKQYALESRSRGRS